VNEMNWIQRLVSRLRFRFGIYLPHIHKEKAGVISEGECWVISHGCWMYCYDTLPKTIWLMIREYRSDRHLVG